MILKLAMMCLKYFAPLNLVKISPLNITAFGRQKIREENVLSMKIRANDILK